MIIAFVNQGNLNFVSQRDSQLLRIKTMIRGDNFDRHHTVCVHRIVVVSRPSILIALTSSQRNGYKTNGQRVNDVARFNYHQNPFLYWRKNKYSPKSVAIVYIYECLSTRFFLE